MGLGLCFASALACGSRSGVVLFDEIVGGNGPPDADTPSGPDAGATRSSSEDASTYAGDDDADAPFASGVPWQECETYSSTICGTWTWNAAGGEFEATWANGAEASITLLRAGSTIVLERIDSAGTSTGLTATYAGTESAGHSVAGSVVWTQDGHTWSGTWTASF